LPLSPARQAREQAQKVPRHRVEPGCSGSRLQMRHQVDPGKLTPSRPAPIDLLDPAPQPVANHGVADLTAGGDPDPRMTERIRAKIKGYQRSLAPATGPVAPQVICPPLQPFLRWQPLAGGPCRAAHQTLRRARPFLRRRDKTARPWRVRIRTRKPWVRLRRRLFG
jgi:hypothetical protein